MQIFSKSKYRNKKTVVDGVKFDSIAESEYYLILKHQELLGTTKLIELQPKIYLTRAKILYKPDFYVQNLETGDCFYIDVKGFSTPVFNIKARLWKAYASLPLHIIKKVGRNFKTEKIIEGVASDD